MSTPQFQNAIQQIQGQRKNPILLLKLQATSRGESLNVYQAMTGKEFKEIDVILHTTGGDIDAAYNITKLLHKHAKKVNIFVPLMAKSAGTLICLCAHELLLTEMSELGPLDAQLKEKIEGDSADWRSALNGSLALSQMQTYTLETFDLALKFLSERTDLKLYDTVSLATQLATKMSEPLYSQMNPYEISEHNRSLQVGKIYGIKVLSEQMGRNDAEGIADHLVHNYPSHSYVVDYSDLQKLKLPVALVDSEIGKNLLDVALGMFSIEGSVIQLIEAPSAILQTTQTTDRVEVLKQDMVSSEV